MKRSYDVEFIKQVLMEQVLKVSFKYYEAERDAREAVESGEAEIMTQADKRGLFMRVQNLQIEHSRLEKAVHLLDNIAEMLGIETLSSEDRTELFTESVPF